LATVPIEFPPLAEQERLVKLLDESDELRKLRTEADRCSVALVPSVFDEMFGDLATNSADIQLERLGDLTTIGTGSTPSRDEPANFGGSIPWVKTTEVNWLSISETEEKLSEKGFEAVRKRIFPKGSIVVAMYGQGKTRGQCAILGVDACVNQACAVLAPSPRFDTVYLYEVLRLSYDKLRSLSQGGNQPNLNLQIVKDFRVPIPPLPQQKEFASYVTKIRDLQDLQAAGRQCLERLYLSMNHRAFEGEL
jgi:type I restriction enzyme, S subunit